VRSQGKGGREGGDEEEDLDIVTRGEMLIKGFNSPVETFAIAIQGQQGKQTAEEKQGWVGKRGWEQREGSKEEGGKDERLRAFSFNVDAFSRSDFNWNNDWWQVGLFCRTHRILPSRSLLFPRAMCGGR